MEIFKYFTTIKNSNKMFLKEKNLGSGQRKLKLHIREQGRVPPWTSHQK